MQISRQAPMAPLLDRRSDVRSTRMRPSRMCVLAVCALFLSLLLGACDATAATSAKHQDATHTAAASARDCGTIAQNLRGTSPVNAHDLAQCLLSAYQTCQAATLRFNKTGDDWRTGYVLVVTPTNGVCQVIDTSVFILDSTSAGGPQPAMTFPCSDVVAQGGAIVVQHCGGDGDIALA